jgi:succinate dehydrogenase / fumarate reductase, flavoprotein subunit
VAAVREGARSEVEARPCDVLVIGTGGAGVRAAIAAVEAGAEVLVVGKRARRDAHTTLAAGGMNAAVATVDHQDSWQQHFADTVIEGYFLGDPRVAEIMTREAPAAVEELAGWGCPFARTPEGLIDTRYFGAHRWRRTCYVGDVTGKAMLDTLVDRAESLGVPFVERQYLAELLVDDGRCAGALAFDLRTGARTAFAAGAVVLATGGNTSLWRRNTSRVGENYGEGMALALRAGCRVMDMELVQFHPTGVVFPPELGGMLVTEAVRGEGGLLFNADGERFMARYDPERMELSTRDRVALANYTEIREGRAGPHGGVFLDISHRGRDYIVEKLPRMYRQFLSLQGIDISKEPMEVAPTAHYSMGGIVVDPETHATDVPGLFAAGECAAGLHGANRLGGNSLSDIVVFGRRAGSAAARFASGVDGIQVSDDVVARAGHTLDETVHDGATTPQKVEAELHAAMWEDCGVVRDEEGLRRGLERVVAVRHRLDEVRVAEGPDGVASLAHVLDLRSGVLAAEASLLGAIERRETRGCHNRSDFPSMDQGLRVNFQQRLGPDGPLTLWSEPVPPVPEDLQRWIDETPQLEHHEKLLE